MGVQDPWLGTWGPRAVGLEVEGQGVGGPAFKEFGPLLGPGRGWAQARGGVWGLSHLCGGLWRAAKWGLQTGFEGEGAPTLRKRRCGIHVSGASYPLVLQAM